VPGGQGGPALEDIFNLDTRTPRGSNALVRQGVQPGTQITTPRQYNPNTDAESLKKTIENYIEKELEPMRYAIVKSKLSLDTLPKKGRKQRVRDIGDIRKDMWKIKTTSLKAIPEYTKLYGEFKNLREAYRKIIYDQAYAPEKRIIRAQKRGGDWISTLEEEWGDLTNKLAESKKSLSHMYRTKLDRYIMFSWLNGKFTKKQQAKVTKVRDKINELETLVGSEYRVWRSSVDTLPNRNAALYYGSEQHKDFEEMLVDAWKLEHKCRDADWTYGLTFRSPTKWAKWMARGLLAAGAAWGIIELVNYIRGDNDKPDDPIEPDYYLRAKSSMALQHDLIQGQNWTTELSDFISTNLPIVNFAMDQNYGGFGKLNTEIINGSLLKVSSPAPELDPGIDSYALRFIAEPGAQFKKDGLKAEQEITINYKDSPAEYEGKVEAAPIDKDGNKPYNITIDNLKDLQGIASVDVRVADGEWTEVYNKADGNIPLPFETMIELNRTIRAQARATTETRIRDARGNEYLKASQTEIKDFVTNVTGGQINKNDFNYNHTTHEASTYTVSGFEAVDWDGIDDASPHSELTIKLTDAKGKEITDTADIDVGQNSINLTYKAGLAPGNCTLEVTHGNNVIFEDEGYIWQKPAEVELKAEDGEYDFLLEGNTTNSTVEATVTNDAGQLTTVAFAVNGLVVAKETFKGTETKDVTLEGFVQGENIVGATPSDYDSENNPYIAATLATTAVVFGSVNHAPNLKADGSLAKVINKPLPLTVGYGRNSTMSVYDLFEDIDGDDLEITNVVFTGGQGTYDNETETLYLRPTATGLQTLNVFAKEKNNPDSSPVTASAEINVNQPASLEDLDCYTGITDDGVTTIYFNGKVKGGAGNLSLEAVVMNGDQEVKVPLNLEGDTFNITSGQLGLSPGVYPITVEGPDENNAPLSERLSKILGDEIVVMPEPKRDIDNQYSYLNNDIKTAIGNDFKQDLIDNKDDWQMVYNITGNIIALHTSYSSSPEQMPLELTEALHYVYEVVIPEKQGDLDGSLLYPVTTIAPNNAKGFKLSAHVAGKDFILDPDLGVFSYEDVRSWNYKFATDQDYGGLTPQERADAILYSAGSIDKGDFNKEFSFQVSSDLVELYRTALDSGQVENIAKQVGSVRKLPAAIRSELFGTTRGDLSVYDMRRLEKF